MINILYNIVTVTFIVIGKNRRVSEELKNNKLNQSNQWNMIFVYLVRIVVDSAGAANAERESRITLAKRSHRVKD